jgi:hypothetical protein
MLPFYLGQLDSVEEDSIITIDLFNYSAYKHKFLQFPDIVLGQYNKLLVVDVMSPVSLQ